MILTNILLSNIFEITLPITDPVIKFLIILVIILAAPILLNKIKIPHLLGLIIAGALIGPHGLNLMERDSSIILSGTAGLLYIMFLAGLEIDLVDFKKNSTKSIVFGMFTFLIPMGIGTLVGLYLLNMTILPAILLASMFASHTLLTYPIISKYGVVKNIAVNITVGGTLITDTLALLVLAIIIGITKGDVNTEFWIRMTLSIILFGLIVMLLFPIIGRWFFKRFNDNVSQYIFVLVMVFSGAALAQIAGIEAIIGAFLSGLALNRLIPATSPLMNRIEFVGNAIFIPFFLIGVGMLVDYKTFFKDLETIKVAVIMIVVATVAKFLAAWFTQKTFKFSADQRRIIFGLSNSQAAATLAAVLVAYNVGLFDDTILNGTILMILFTCTIASFVTQKGAKNIALQETNETPLNEKDNKERILIPINNIDTTDELINLGVTIKSKKNKDGLYALNIIDSNSNDGTADKKAHKILNKASITASATDNHLHELLRYDINIVSGITSVIKENKITDLILGLHEKKGFSNSFLGNLTEGILTKINTTTLIYKPIQPFGTIKRHIIIVPDKAEKEIGFSLWLIKISNIAKNSGAKLILYATETTMKIIKEFLQKQSIEGEYKIFNDWDDFLILARDFHINDNLIIIMSRKDNQSYQSNMSKIPLYLNRYFKDNSFILIYPSQLGVSDPSAFDLKNATMIEPIEKLDEISKNIAKVFKKK